MTTGKHWITILSLWLISTMGLAADNGKLTAPDYIAMWKDEAIYQMALHKIPASITLAQGLLESGNGNSRLATEANNHFGIKCHKEWTGPTLHQDDDEKNECFRKYTHARESYEDHSQFLLTRKRYESLFALKPDDFEGWARGLKECGYATNPRYPELLIDLVKRYELHRYDLEGMRYISEGKTPPRPGTDIEPLAKTDKKPAHKPKRHKTGDGGFGEVVISLNHKIELSDNRIKYTTAKAGDTPQSLAEELGMAAWQIRKYNDLDKDQPLTEGQRLYLQPKRNKGTQENCTVKQGDTLKSISQLYGIKLKHLKKKNNLTGDEVLKPGQVLRLK